KFQSTIQISMQQILRLLHLNLFEKRDLMALLPGDPPINRCKYDNQPTLF
ncbi:MAG TPA: IS4 family transposase, partial [Nitrosomonas nitrosa]|nr:IS4 family transposase [Nitrosomonas nitrosa]